MRALLTALLSLVVLGSALAGVALAKPPQALVPSAVDDACVSALDALSAAEASLMGATATVAKSAKESEKAAKARRAAAKRLRKAKRSQVVSQVRAAEKKFAKAKKKLAKAKAVARSARTAQAAAAAGVAAAQSRLVAVCVGTEVGQPYAGGILVGITQDDAGLRYALVASPRDLEFAPYAYEPVLFWDNYSNRTGSNRWAPHASDWDGLANTQAGAAVDEDYRIFRHVAALEHPDDGGSPWYVPAKNELNVLWQSLGDVGLAFHYQRNGNPYEAWWLWSSTEDDRFGDPYGAWGQGFRSDDDSQGTGAKSRSYDQGGVRPVRRVALAAGRSVLAG